MSEIVSREYQQQLDQLAAELVLNRRFALHVGDAALGQTIEFEPIADVVALRPNHEPLVA